MYVFPFKFRLSIGAGLIFLALFSSLAHAGKPTLVVLGDSLSAAYQLPPGSGFPEQLQWILNRNGVDITVKNAGVSGDTTAGGLARLDWAIDKKTDFVIVELGANDALRGVDPAQTFKNLDKIIVKLKAKGIKVLLAGMQAPRNMGQPFVQKFDAIYPKLAKKHKILLYPFFLKGVILQKPLLLRDGMHPNEKGVSKIVENILPHVERLLAK